MLLSVKTLYKDFRDAQEALYSAIPGLRAAIPTMSLEELADLAYAMREINTLVKDAATMSNGTRETAEQVGCVIAIKDSVTKIRTEHVTATPQLRMIAAVPKKGTPEFGALMEFLGVDEQLSSGTKPIVDINWHGYVEYLTNAMQEGKPIPPGVDIDRTYPKYSFRLTKKPRTSVLS